MLPINLNLKRCLSYFCSTLIIISINSPGAFSQIKERNILANEATSIDLAKSLITGNTWNKLPDYKNRNFWESVPANLKKDYISRAESYINYDWPVVKATDYLEFIRSGERRQNVYAAPSKALNSLVIGELIEGKGRFIDQIINAVWYYSEQTWWGWSAHLYFQKASGGLPDVNEPTVDLGVGEITNDLSWTWYLFKDEFDKVHPLISKRLRQEIINKALKPYFERNDFGYMGFKGGRPNNWNPWVNYNMLNCFLLLEDDPASKIAEVQKIINSLDKFLNGYSDDGGCDEGPSYWGAAGAMLYESLAILKEATGGKFDVYNDPLIKNIGKYFYKVNIHAPYFINFADADATTGGSPASVYQYGKAINDSQMLEFGAYLAKLNKWGETIFTGKICEQIKNMVLMPEILNADSKEALIPDFWLPETEIAGARDKEGSYKGFFFGAKGGFNAESHNHNDVGSCVMYYDGKPCLIDLGREGYTSKTFSSRRYEIWTMQSGYHNLPVINGTDQKDGADFKAMNTSFSANDKKVVFSTDIAGAYPKEAMVKSWIRNYTLNRGKSFVISDKFELVTRKSSVTSSNLMTYCRVTQIKPGELKFEGDDFTLKMVYNPEVVTPEIQYIEITDATLKHYWPKGVTRVILRYIKGGTKGGQNLIFTPVQGIQSWRAPEQIVEKLEKEKSGFNYTEVKVPEFTLPEILTSNNGAKITSVELWNTLRRPEIVELFRKYMFGRVPETQYHKKFKIVSLDKHSMEGIATQKKVEITIEADGKSLIFNLTLFTPNNVKKAVPVFLLIDPWLSDKDSPHWKQKDEYWPVKEALKRGYGMAVFNSSDLDPDNFDNFKNGIHGLLDQKVRPDDAWGTLAAWAWGASRCMDYLVTDKDVASDKVAVVGHSRAGKTALWAGAEDTRFALVVSNESGAGGAALAMRRYGETVARLNSSFPHWFCSNYNKYSNNEDSLPVDMHMLLALIAPRALYVDCADEDLWGDPKGSYMSLYNAIPVFNLLGRNSDIPESMPPLNKQVISGRVAFHIRDGAHNLLLKDWNWFMDFADKVLR
jgi:Heparinase II/III-like protein